MTINLSLILFILFSLKHLVVDFFWQTQYEIENKGTLLHPGGIQHSTKHAVFTYLILLTFSIVLNLSWLPISIAILAHGEFFAHYIIDYGKMNLNSYLKLNPAQPQFWWLLGFDQYLHHLTYIIIIAILCAI